MGQAQNLTKGQDGPGHPVNIRDGTRDGTVRVLPTCIFTYTNEKKVPPTHVFTFRLIRALSMFYHLVLPIHT